MTTAVDQAEPVPVRRTRGEWRRWLSDIAWPVGTMLLAIGAWEAYVRLGDVPLYILAPASDTFKAAYTDAPTLLSNSLVTIKEMVLGFLLAIGVGIPLALMLDRWERFERTFYPFLVGSQVMPLVALAPAIVLWFGVGLLPKVLIVATFGTFVIVLETLVGLRSLDIQHVHLSRSIGARPLAFFLKIKIPNALPHIFGGLKLAGTLSVIGAVVAEFISSSEGLGWYVLTANANVKTVQLFSGLIYLTLIGIIVFVFMDFLERLAIPWHPSHRLESFRAM